MRIEALFIGSELLSGQTQDLHTQWLGSFLQRHHLSLQQVTLIKDDLAQIQQGLDLCWRRADILLVTGGLGPTLDDQTKQALSDFFHVPLEFSKKAQNIAIKNYHRFDKNFLKQKSSYDQDPQGFDPLENFQGLAPGLSFKQNGKLLLVAPGVPKEFQSMFEHQFFPLLQQHLPPATTLQKRLSIRTHGIAEEHIFFKLCPTLWQDLSQWGEVSALPQGLGVDIDVLLTGKDDQKLQQKSAQVEALVQSSQLAPYIWQWGTQSLEEVIIHKLKQHNQTLAVAESCTGGLLGHQLTSVAGSSQVFQGGVISYSNQSKQDLLHVSAANLQKHGAVSSQVAEEMAKGAQQKLKADYALALTGIAGPGGGSIEKPVGTIAIGLTTPQKTQSFWLKFHGTRDALKARFARKALFLLLEELSSEFQGQ